STPNAAAAPASPHIGKNAYAKTMLAADVAATITNRGRTRLDTRRRVMKTLFARTRGLASARITRDSYPAPEYAGPKNRRIHRPRPTATRTPVTRKAIEKPIAWRVSRAKLASGWEPSTNAEDVNAAGAS